MQSGLVTCTRCKAYLPAALFNLPDLAPCPSCHEQLRAQVFPALFHTVAIVSPEALVFENESSCFYHPQKKAAVPCDSCGRFLCALCDLDFNGQHICPTCLESGKKKRKIKNLENSRTLYDKIAFWTATLPLLLGFWPSIIGAPIALYMAIRYRKQPCSIVGRSKILFTIAAILASLEILAWIGIFVYLARK